jgi:undecaprenyl-diphosphatase
MTIFDAVVLGLIQGLTEFLPISSSGHLILVREMLGINDGTGLGVDAVLQLASGIAVVIYFWKDLTGIANSVCSAFSKRCSPFTIDGGVIASAIALSTIPIVFAGMYLESYMETAFRSVNLVILSLLAGSLLIIIAEFVYKRRVNSEKGFAPLTLWRGFVIGLYQLLALIPGFSRSGATISAGLIVGLTREQAGRYSFLLAIPIVLGAGAKKLIDGGVAIDTALIIGTLVSFVVSLATIHFLLLYIRKHSLMPFVWYRLILAVVLLAAF